MEQLFLYLTDLTGGGAYGIIFGVLIACGLGFPLPEDVPLIACGYLIWDGTMNWASALFVCMVGVLGGDTILYLLGRKLGIRVLDNPRVQTILKPEKIQRTRDYFKKYGDKIVFFARFVAGFRAAAFFLAGTLGMRYRRFMLFDGIAAFLSVPVWIGIGYGLGYYFGDEISSILKSMKQMKTGISIVIFTLVAIFAIRAFIKYRKSHQKLPNGNSL